MYPLSDQTKILVMSFQKSGVCYISPFVSFQSEQFELKKQLADYAIQLNMEASKGREFKAKSFE